MAKELRGGYTTGACVAAGVKAAALFMQGSSNEGIEITALDGTRLTIPIKNIEAAGDGIRVEVVKDAGDDPDITNGVSIFTTLILDKALADIEYIAGDGVGRVTKEGLAVPPGEPAINPGPRQLIRQSLLEAFGYVPGCRVRIDVPGGSTGRDIYYRNYRRTATYVRGGVQGLSGAPDKGSFGRRL